MQLFDIQDHPHLLHDIQVEQASQLAIHTMIVAYLQTLPTEGQTYAQFLDVFNLCIRRAHDFKLKRLEQAGVDKASIQAIQQQLQEYDEQVEKYSLPAMKKWRQGYTSPVSAGAMTALNFNKASILKNPRLPEFLSNYFHLIHQLMDEPGLSEGQVWSAYANAFGNSGFPEYFNAKTLANSLYIMRPDVFPLINDHVLGELKKLLKNKVELSPEGYSAAATEMKTALNRMTGGAQHFGQLDRIVSYQIEHPEALDAQPGKQTENKFIPAPNVPLNTIFYGPPGTGKTYHTVTRAVQILDPECYEQYEGVATEISRPALKKRFDELVGEGRISMTTFHQSFAYEDFVEGIKAETLQDEVGDKQGIQYLVQDGVFKTLCQSANSRPTLTIADDIDLKGRRVWKMSLGNTSNSSDDYIFPECQDNNYILLGWGGNLDFTNRTSKTQIREVHEEVNWLNTHSINTVNTFINRIAVGDLVVISDGNHRFRGIAEVTGDYAYLQEQATDRDSYLQQRAVRWLQVYAPSRPVDQIINKVFSQNTLHSLDASIDHGKLKKLLQPETLASTQPSISPYVLIIDEINRGNISRIFGELITLLEPSKRNGADDQQHVILPYSKQPFSVPANVYVIGTMNTADRSLAQLDIALRRRFEFEEMLPEPELLAGVEIEGINLGKLLQIINERIEILLGRDYMLGHSYLIGLNNDSSLADLASVFQKRILPLLQEYFFADWEKIRLVLNDQCKSPENQLVMPPESGNSLDVLFGDNTDSITNLSDQRYCLQKSALQHAQSFAQIIPDDAV